MEKSKNLKDSHWDFKNNNLIHDIFCEVEKFFSYYLDHFKKNICIHDSNKEFLLQVMKLVSKEEKEMVQNPSSRS
jgi:hypothetical protein